MSQPKLSVQPCPHPKVSRVYIRVAGQPVRQCAVRCLNQSGLVIKTDMRLPRGEQVELAFFRLHTPQLVKVVRRSAYVVRAADTGIAMLFFLRRTPRP